MWPALPTAPGMCLLHRRPAQPPCSIQWGLWWQWEAVLRLLPLCVRGWQMAGGGRRVAALPAAAAAASSAAWAWLVGGRVLRRGRQAGRQAGGRLGAVQLGSPVLPPCAWHHSLLARPPLPPQHSQHSGKLEQDLLNCQGELLVANNRWDGWGWAALGAGWVAAPCSGRPQAPAARPRAPPRRSRPVPASCLSPRPSAQRRSQHPRALLRAWRGAG